MAHLEHYKMDDVKRLANEWTRERWTDREGRTDPERTKLNYVMDDKHNQASGMAVKHPRQVAAAVKGRLNQVTHSKRKDLNVVSNWIVTIPQELKGQEERFFRVVYDFTCDRYGHDNVLQGFVHMDETTPHIHMPVVPVIDGKVSSKALFTRKELHDYQADLDEVISSEFGQPHLMLNGRTKGNYTFRELKERTKREEELAAKEAQAEKNLQAAQAVLDAARIASEKIQDQLARERAQAALEKVEKAKRQVKRVLPDTTFIEPGADDLELDGLLR